MIYVVDRIEEEIAVLENKNTKEIINININNLPLGIKEGNVLIYKDNKYIIDKYTEKLKRQMILEKFNKLRKHSE